MDYVFEKVIPANTAEANAVTEEQFLPHGIIQRVAIYFPWGCKNLAHVTIWYNEHQVWPTQLDKNYSGNEVLFEFPESYELKETWNRITVRGWNEDDTYDHTPIVHITLLVEAVPHWAKVIFNSLFGGSH